jgi:hypothetical protein
MRLDEHKHMKKADRKMFEKGIFPAKDPKAKTFSKGSRPGRSKRHRA